MVPPIMNNNNKNKNENNESNNKKRRYRHPQPPPTRAASIHHHNNNENRNRLMTMRTSGGGDGEEEEGIPITQPARTTTKMSVECFWICLCHDARRETVPLLLDLSKPKSNGVSFFFLIRFYG